MEETGETDRAAKHSLAHERWGGSRWELMEFGRRISWQQFQVGVNLSYFPWEPGDASRVGHNGKGSRRAKPRLESNLPL